MIDSSDVMRKHECQSLRIGPLLLTQPARRTSGGSGDQTWGGTQGSGDYT